MAWASGVELASCQFQCLDAVAHGGNHGSRSWGEPPRPRCLPKTALHRYIFGRAGCPPHSY
ncbi:hypothetical protein [Moorena sp. SIOASIH]|uniref:hypothetical protein n=1 Tax=Moorena sp. SIOASIH TaxID=2607817 RepID=UPI0025E12CDC|nr:hypothetical protein [Moorena sp. SIOASIH]